MFDFEKLEKEIRKEKVEISCPECELYIGEYSMNELDILGEIYCNNCDILINYNVIN